MSRTDRTGAQNDDAASRGAAAAPRARKGAGEENFPVASLLLSPARRPTVMAFYDFVRLADDIADDSGLPAHQKLGRLDELEQALVAGRGDDDWRRPAAALRRALDRCGVPDRFARDLLRAFRRDAHNRPCRDWDDLIDYCRYSAMPVGRFLMALHGENDAPGPASDALCTALQILNHLQDCAEDWRQLGRLYVPLTWLAAEGLTPDDLLSPASSAALRRVLDRVLGGVDQLLLTAAPLGRQMRDRRLGLEAAVIVRLAKALRDRLYRDDPLAGRVELSKPRFAAIAAAAVLARLAGR
jgi:hydroxysqualene synthase